MDGAGYNKREGAAPEFRSFLLAGFECSAPVTHEGRRLDLLAASGHDRCSLSDYEAIAKIGMRTVREGFQWSRIDLGGGGYDFSRYLPMLQAAKEYGVQQIWDLSHFDFPERLDPLSGEFVDAYAEYSKRVIEVLRRYTAETLYIVPMNEPSFFAWMSECGLWSPFLGQNSYLFKRQLVRGAVGAMKAIWSIDRNVRFIHADPFMYRLPGRSDDLRDRKYCELFNEHTRWESWDLIAGRREPELGGRPEFLDIVGINYYLHNQQFALDDGGKEPFFECLALDDPRRLTISDIIRQVHDRYGRPAVLTETGSYEENRPAWWDTILSQVRDTLEQKLPLYGVCSYPTLDVTADAGFVIPYSGLWDFAPDDPDCRRIPHQPTIDVISRYDQLLNKTRAKASGSRAAHA
jgi:beta-glucosidase/6-phospho-beta-glucosidase/beta-galactosidase